MGEAKTSHESANTSSCRPRSPWRDPKRDCGKFVNFSIRSLRSRVSKVSPEAETSQFLFTSRGPPNTQKNFFLSRLAHNSLTSLELRHCRVIILQLTVVSERSRRSPIQINIENSFNPLRSFGVMWSLLFSARKLLSCFRWSWNELAGPVTSFECVEKYHSDRLERSTQQSRLINAFSRFLASLTHFSKAARENLIRPRPLFVGQQALRVSH